MAKPKVILRHCDTYDSERIARIIGEGMDELGVRPTGKTLVKPNVVFAHQEVFPHAYTRQEFIDGLLTAVRQRGEGITELKVGEKCGITIPTRYLFAMAGYLPVLRKHGVRAEYFDEGAQVPVHLKHPQALRDLIYVPEAVAECEFLINAPKFKAHPWTKVTFSIKNYIGIQDDAQRLIDHDHLLHTKIADLQEVIAPGFIAIDAITAGERTMLTPDPYPLHLIVMGTNRVAVDAVCSQLVGLDPNDIDHIRMTAERGYGPMDLEAIELSGDVSLEEGKRRGANLRLTLDRVEQIFNGKSNITTYVGPPPDTYDYCWGGCPGSLFEAIQIIHAFQPDVYHQVRNMHVVFGAYSGELPAPPGEPVLFMGDCARWQGRLQGRKVDIPSLYRQRHTKHPSTAASADVVGKMVGVMRNLLRHRGRTVIRVAGCPVSVAENVLYLSWLGRTMNPYFHRKIVFDFSYYWLLSGLARRARSLTARRPTGQL